MEIRTQRALQKINIPTWSLIYYDLTFYINGSQPNFKIVKFYFEFLFGRENDHWKDFKISELGYRF